MPFEPARIWRIPSVRIRCRIERADGARCTRAPTEPEAVQFSGVADNRPIRSRTPRCSRLTCVLYKPPQARPCRRFAAAASLASPGPTPHRGRPAGASIGAHLLTCDSSRHTPEGPLTGWGSSARPEREASAEGDDSLTAARDCDRGDALHATTTRTIGVCRLTGRPRQGTQDVLRDS